MAFKAEEIFIALRMNAMGLLRPAQMATAALAKIGVAAQTAGAAVTAAGAQMRSVGMSLSMYFTAPIVAAGGAVTVMGASFESEMSKIIGLVGVSRDQVDSWSSEILNLAPQLGKSPQELATALFYITSAGYRGADAMDVLRASAMAATGGLGETAAIADAATSAVNAYGLEVLSAMQATDILTAAVREGKLEAASLAPVMGTVVPMASAMGVAFSDVAGTLAVFSRTGVNAARGATSLNSLLMVMQKPTQDAEQALASVGLTFGDLRAMIREPGGIIDVLRLLQTSFEGDEEAMATLIPNVRALRGAMNVLAQDAATVDSVMEGVRNSAGSTQYAFETMTQTVKFQLLRVWRQFQAVAIRISGTLSSVLVPLADKLTEAIRSLGEWWNGLNERSRKFIIYAAMAAAALGPVLVVAGTALMMFGSLVTTLTTASGIITTLVIGVGGFAAAFGLLEMAANGVDFAKMFQDGKSALAGFAEKAAGFFMNFRENMDTLREWFKDQWPNMLSDAGNAVGAVAGNLGNNLKVIAGMVVRVLAKINSAITYAFVVTLPNLVLQGAFAAVEKLEENSRELRNRTLAALAGVRYNGSRTSSAGLAKEGKAGGKDGGLMGELSEILNTGLEDLDWNLLSGMEWKTVLPDLNFAGFGAEAAGEMYGPVKNGWKEAVRDGAVEGAVEAAQMTRGAVAQSIQAIRTGSVASYAARLEYAQRIPQAIGAPAAADALPEKVDKSNSWLQQIAEGIGEMLKRDPYSVSNFDAIVEAGLG